GDRDEADLEVLLLERAGLVLSQRPGGAEGKGRGERGAGRGRAHALDELTPAPRAAEDRVLDRALDHPLELCHVSSLETENGAPCLGAPLSRRLATSLSRMLVG